MKEKVSKLVDSKIKDYNVYVTDAFIETVENRPVFNIVLDSPDIIDLDKITEVSRIINEIMDNTDEIKEDYDELDIYSEEKGEVEDE